MNQRLEMTRNERNCLAAIFVIWTIMGMIEKAPAEEHVLTAKEKAHWKAVDLRQRGQLDDGKFYLTMPVEK